MALRNVGFGTEKREENLVKKPLVKFLKEDYKQHPRAPGFHPSQIYGMCEMQEAFKLLFPEKASECEPRPFPGLFLNYGIGHAIHDLIQNKYLGPSGILKGKWKCQSCGHTHKGFMPEGCENCECPTVHYREVSVRYDELDIVGHTDGIIATEIGDITLDIKTIHRDAYERLTEPKEANVWQLNVYMKCLGHDVGVLMYVNKDRQFDRYSKEINIKEFRINRSDEIWEKIKNKINRVRNLPKILEKLGKKALIKTIPKLNAPCQTRSYWKARQCPFSKKCFKIRGK